MKCLYVKTRILPGLKLTFTVLLCLFLILQADWLAVGNALRDANLLLMLVVVMSMFFCVTISAVKWQLLLSIHDVSFNLRVLHRYYLVGLFFNNFLPSTIGGDIYRIYMTLSNQKPRACAVIAVFLERLTGIWALLFLGFAAGMILILRQAATVHFIKPATLVFACGVVVPMVAVFFLIGLGSKTFIASRIPPTVRMIIDHLSDFRRQRNKTIQVVLISFFFHIFSLGWMWLLLRAIGTDFSIIKLTVTVLISQLVAILPFSINGIGLMDGSFVYVATAFGMEYNCALTFLILMRSITFFVSLIGGGAYLQDRCQVDIKELQREKINIKGSTF